MDRVNPQFTTSAILTDNSSKRNNKNTLILSETCSDDNLFECIINISRNSDNLVMWNRSQFNISTSSYTFTDSIPLTLFTDGNYSVRYIASDDHTAKEVESIGTTKDIGQLKLTFTTNNSDNIGVKVKGMSHNMTLINAGSIWLGNKYAFFFNFSDGINDKNGSNYSYTFSVTNKFNLTNIIDSEFPAHFVTSKNFIDFDMRRYDGNAVYVISKPKNAQGFEVTIYTTLTNLVFDSIGGLNILDVTYNLNIESNNPNITITYPGNNTYIRGGLNISGHVIDENSIYNTTTNITNITNFGTAQNFSFINRSTLLVEQNYSILVSSNDSVGNIGNITAYYVILDNTPPGFKINITGGNFEGFIDNIVIDWNVTDLYLNLTNINITNPDGIIIKNSSNHNNNINILSSELNTTGAYIIRLLGSDFAGNTNESNLSFSVVDTRSPEVNYTRPPTPNDNSVGTSHNFTINVSFSDVSNVTRCISEINNTNYTMSIKFNVNTNKSGYCNLTINTSESSLYSFRVYTYDISNNINITNTLTFLENGKPFVSNGNFSVFPIYSNTSATVTYTFSDNNSHIENVTTYQWYINRVKISGQTSVTLSNANYINGYNITAEVRPYDGYEFGEKLNVSTTVLSSVPNVSNVNISATFSNGTIISFINFYANNTLLGNYTFTSFDNLTDQSNYTWYKNSVKINNTNSRVLNTTITKSNGDTTAYDGIKVGNNVNYSITINNSIPVILEVLPMSGSFDTSMLIQCVATDSDPNDNLSYSLDLYFKDNSTGAQYWHKNVTTLSTILIDVTNITQQSGFDINCTVSDGTSTIHSNPNGTVSIIKRLNIDILYAGFKNKLNSESYIPLGISCDISNAFSIYIDNIYADCENDGITDYVFRYNGTNAQNKKDFFNCVYLFPGNVTFSGGCVLNKLGSTSWVLKDCAALPSTEDYCDINIRTNLEILRIGAYNK